MAKESMKARERKRAKLVEKYAKKRAELKAAGDYVGLQKYPKCFTSKTTQQLSINWQSKRLYETIWY